MSYGPTMTERLMAIGFKPWDGNFANNKRANNKLELDHDRLKQYPQLYSDVIRDMCEQVEAYRPKFFVGVPNGATGIAKTMAREYNVPHVVLKKDPETGVMDYADQRSLSVVQRTCDGIIIEDVHRTGSSLERALRINELAAKVVVGACVFNRSVAATAHPGDVVLDLPVDILAVARQPIPSELDEASGLWAYAATAAETQRLSELRQHEF